MLPILLAIARLALGFPLVQRLVFGFGVQAPGDCADAAPSVALRPALNGSLAARGATRGPTGRFTAEIQGGGRPARRRLPLRQPPHPRGGLGAGGRSIPPCGGRRWDGRRFRHLLGRDHADGLPPAPAGGRVLDMTDRLRRDAYDGIVDRAQFRRFGFSGSANAWARSGPVTGDR